MELVHIQGILETSDRDPLPYDLRFRRQAEPHPVLIVVHGFKGFKDWGFFPFVAESFAGKGWLTVQFNFSHNGVAGHGEKFTRLDRFAANTFTREIRELREVVDAVSDGRFASHLSDDVLIDSSTIALLGHSRGGGIVLLEAARDSRISAVVTWGAVSSFDRYSGRQLSEWETKGYLEIPNARTGQTMRLGRELLDDLRTNHDALDIQKNVADLNIPILIVHGDVDLSVTVDNALRLKENADPDRSELVRIPKTGHTFGAVHPFSGETEALLAAIEATDTFLNRRLSLRTHAGH